MKSPSSPTSACTACRDGQALDFDFTMAFQPIVDVRDRTVYAYEALVRGLDGSSAQSILDQVTPQNLYAFDQACRVKAVELAASLAMTCRLSINFLPNAVYQPEACIRATLQAAQRCGFPTERIIFEIAERENLLDKAHLQGILRAYRRHGFLTAIDDFGAGYSGLNLLADFQPDLLKIDMALVRGIDSDPVRQAIVRSIAGLCETLHVQALAEGVETAEELTALRGLGIHLFQGYLFARPALERLAQVQWPDGDPPAG